MNLSASDQQRAVDETRALLARLSVSSQLVLLRQSSVDGQDYLNKIQTAYYEALRKAAEAEAKIPKKIGNNAEGRRNASKEIQSSIPSLGVFITSIIGVVLAGVGCAHVRSRTLQ